MLLILCVVSVRLLAAHCKRRVSVCQKRTVGANNVVKCRQFLLTRSCWQPHWKRGIVRFAVRLLVCFAVHWSARLPHSQDATQPGCHTAYEPTLPLLLCSASRPILWTCQWLCGPAFPLFRRFSCPPNTCGREKSLGTFSISSFHHLRRTLPEIEISLPSTNTIFLHSQEMQPLRLQIFNSFK